MPWLSVPTALHLFDNQDTHGYLLGIEEEAGFFAYKTDAYDGYEKVIVSDSVAPKIVIDDNDYTLRGYRYNGNPVWAASNNGPYIFTSVSKGRILMAELREPYLRPKLTGETDLDQIGDSWWTVPDMKLGQTVVLRAQGVARETAGGEGNKTGTKQWNVWLPIVNEHGFFGIFENPDDLSIKTIGVPVFRVANGPDEYAAEDFARSIRKEDGYPVYRGSRGHSIRWNWTRRKFVAGTVGSGVWFERDEMLTVPRDGRGGSSWFGNSLTLDAMCVDPKTGAIVQAQVRDLTLQFRGYGFGVDREEVYVSEVEEWR